MKVDLDRPNTGASWHCCSDGTLFLSTSTRGHYSGTPSKILRKSISETLFSAGSFILFKHRSGLNNDNLYGLR